MYQLKAKAAFDSAHFLSGYKGKCANLHGHRWTIEVIVEQEDLQTERMHIRFSFPAASSSVSLLPEHYV